MNTSEKEHFNLLYQQHLTNFALQGMRPATIDAYSRAVRRITFFLTTRQTPSLKLIENITLHSSFKLSLGAPLN